ASLTTVFPMAQMRSRSKYYGAVLGALVGDCIGAQFESGWCPVAFSTLLKLTDTLKEKVSDGSSEKWMLYYTDDTEMAHELGKSMLSKGAFDAKNVAECFGETYFASKPCRWYGGSVPNVFKQLQAVRYKGDPYGPAAKQFNGQGSYGNGSAMRVFPVSLFYFEDVDKVMHFAACSSKITHSHINAINGAILQALAVHTALSSSRDTTWDIVLNKLTKYAEKLEESKSIDSRVYCQKLNEMYRMILAKHIPTQNEIDDKIGTGIRSDEAMCAALFSFLLILAGKSPPELSHLSPICQVILYAISLGGDTDTIATMAGAIAGAYYGEEGIPKNWIQACEGNEEACNLALNLFN
uniref:ADP-ribosylhydrolase ARH3 n=1 Tax=Ciona intestinalis TaxID=7719 RepID=H2XRC4_CIOIN